MPLQRSLTLDDTGVECPEAYGVEDWHLEGSKNIALITLTWWKDKAAYDAARTPVFTETLTLTLAEQQAGSAHLVGVLDDILLQRPEFASVLAVD